MIGAHDATGHAVVAYLRVSGLRPDDVVDAVREPLRGRARRVQAADPLEVVDELPTTLAGRVRKGALRQLERREALGILE